jgi:peptidoglycan/xylan/chitin deacetylase (PgdA/CDA1 family)
LACFERHGVRATFFIPGWDALNYPDVMSAIVGAGHETAGHGFVHEDFSNLNVDEQIDVLARSEAAFEQVFGARPEGWRAPLGFMSSATRALLIERGYRYDSSYCDDDVPYVVETGDGRRLVELPVFQPLGDRHYYALRRSPEVVARAWREEFEAVYRVGGLFNLHLRPRGEVGSGRAVRVRAVDDILEQIAATPNIWFATCATLAEWSLAELPTTVREP